MKRNTKQLIPMILVFTIIAAGYSCRMLAMFDIGGGSTEHVPEAVISESDLVDGKADIMSLLVLSGLCASRSDARRNIQQGGVLCGEEKVTDIAKAFDGEELRKGVVLRRGKKNFKRVILK